MHKSVIKANKGGSQHFGKHTEADLRQGSSLALLYVHTRTYEEQKVPGPHPQPVFPQARDTLPAPKALHTHLLSKERNHLGTDRTQALHNLSLVEKQQAGSDWRGAATSTIQPPAGLSICGVDWLRSPRG